MTVGALLHHQPQRIRLQTRSIYTTIRSVLFLYVYWFYLTVVYIDVVRFSLYVNVLHVNICVHHDLCSKINHKLA